MTRGLVYGSEIEADVSKDGFFLEAGRAKRPTAVTMVHDALHAAILRGDLPADSRLVQTDIAAQLGVSTTPVREAMRDLATEGFIELDSFKIGIVRRPGWDEMQEIVAIRRCLERMALELAMAHADEAFLDAAQAKAEELAEVSDVGNWVQKNSQFHGLFHQRTRTKRLANILVALENSGGLFVAQAQRLQPEIRERAVDDHFQLIQAFRASDLERATEIQYGHIHLPLQAAASD